MSLLCFLKFCLLQCQVRRMHFAIGSLRGVRDFQERWLEC